MAEDETDGRGGLRRRSEMVRPTGRLGFRDGRLYQQIEVVDATIGAAWGTLRTEWRPVPTIPDGESVVEE